MADIHIYVPDSFLSDWKEEFANRGDASQWIQEQFLKLRAGKFDLQTLKKQLLERKQAIQQFQLEVENLEKDIARLEIAEKHRIKDAEKQITVIAEIDPYQLRQMTKGIISMYGLKETDARITAIEYLSIPVNERPILRDFMKPRIQQVQVKSQ